MEKSSELSVMLHSMKLEKKWILIGSSIGLASLLGISYWVYQKYNIKKEEMIAEYLNKFRHNYEKSLVVKPRENQQKEKHSFEENEKKLKKDFAYALSKYIYKGAKLDKLLHKVNTDTQTAKDFGLRFYDIYAELLNQFLRFIQDQIKHKQLPNYVYLIDFIFDFIFEQFLLQLKYAKQYECDLIKGLVTRMFNHMILSDLLQTHNDLKSSIPPSHLDQQHETNYFEMMIRYTKLMKIKTQDSLLAIMKQLIEYDQRFKQFLQLCLAKNISFVSCLDSNFSQALIELSASRKDDIAHQSYGRNSINLRQELSNSYTQPNYSARGQTPSGGMKTQGSMQNYSLSSEQKRKLIPSPLCSILSEGISIGCATQMIQEGFAYRIIENLCELSQKCSSDLQDLEKVLSNLFQIVMNIIENRQNNQQFFQLYKEDILDILLKSLTFQETNETTTVSNSNIVDLVNWITFNLDIVLIRAKCSTWIQKILITFISQNKESTAQVGRLYLQEVRRIHKIRREDNLKGYQQLETDLSITSFFLHLVLNSMQEVPQFKNIRDNFLSAIPFEDEQERYFVIKSFSSLLQNYVFMKELYICMLEKSCTQTNHLIMTLSDFKNFFYSPDGKKYDEILLALQFMILLGGADSLCDTIVARWQKDADEYEDFKIYMSSDISFFLQLLENDICYLNVNSNWQEALKSYESKANYRYHAYVKVQKLIINYLQIFGPMEKESIRAYLKHQIANPILDSDHIFDSALDEVAVKTVKTSSGNGNLYYSNNSSFSQNQNQFNNHIGTFNTKYELKEQFEHKYFHSLFNRDTPMLVKLLNTIQTNQQNSITINQHDLHIESLLNERDTPMEYLKQVRRAILENIRLHTSFREIFIENIPILLEKLRVVCRILHYIFDVIEEGIMDCRASKKISKDSIKSLLVKYIFDPVIAEKITYVSQLTDEDGELLAQQFIPTLQNLSFRREAIKDLIKDIFKGVNIANIIT